jgi:hypothetical protein
MMHLAAQYAIRHAAAIGKGVAECFFSLFVTRLKCGLNKRRMGAATIRWRLLGWALLEHGQASIFADQPSP